MATWSESFNTADSTTLGPDQTWTERGSGSVEIVGNAVRGPAGNIISSATIAVPSAIARKWVRVTVKTLVASSTATRMFLFLGYDATNSYGIQLSWSGSAWQVGAAVIPHAGGGSWNTAGTVTVPSTPFTLEARTNNTSGQASYDLLINGTSVATGLTMAGGVLTGGSGFGLTPFNATADIEIDDFATGDTLPLPSPLPSYAWPVDGIAWVGPFISSTGNVYVLNGNTSGNVSMLKATDPTATFSAAGTAFVTSGGANASWNAHQVGDLIYCVGFGATNMDYGVFDMSTDTMSQPAGTSGVTVGAPVNGGCAIAKRATNNDVIVGYNTVGVVNMGKTYGRIACRRITGGTTWSAETALSTITPLSTNLNAESIDGALLDGSDRVHFFWCQGENIAAGNQTKYSRAVLGTENLNGTAPASAMATVNGRGLNPLVDGVGHEQSQAFISSAGTLGVLTTSGDTSGNIRVYGTLQVSRATPAASPTWAQTTVTSTDLANVNAIGATNRVARFGGAPWDGTNQYAVWLANSGLGYVANTGSGWGAFTLIAAIGTTTVSSNIYQRGNDIVLALVYSTNGGAAPWVYDEIVLRTVAAADRPPQRRDVRQAVNRGSFY